MIIGDTSIITKEDTIIYGGYSVITKEDTIIYGGYSVITKEDLEIYNFCIDNGLNYDEIYSKIIKY